MAGQYASYSGFGGAGGGGGTVTSVTASAPLSSSGGTTPDISLSGIVAINHGGTGSATQNFVDLTTAQTIGGVKTFSSILNADAGLDRSTAGNLDIGPTAGTNIRLGHSAGALSIRSDLIGFAASSNITFGATSTISIGSNKLTNVTDPTNPQDAATKAYVDASAGANTALSNLTTTSINQGLVPSIDSSFNLGTTTKVWDFLYINQISDASNITAIHIPARQLRNSSAATVIDFSGTDPSLNTHKLTNVVDPTSPQDAATKAYVDAASSGANTSLSNLITTSINQDLLPDGDFTRSIGADGLSFNEMRVGVLVDGVTGDAVLDVAGYAIYRPGSVIAIDFNGTSPDFQGTTIVNVADPVNPQDVATKSYVDTSAGSVTNVSVVSANGFSGTVATSSTTPAITLATTITGILKGNGTSISAATSGTDYVIPSGTVSNVTGTVSEIHGGTNQTTYTTGDLLYASASNTLSKLSIGSSGQILKVVTGNPAWATDTAAVITAWTAYTPSFTNNGGAASGVDFIWRQVGPDSIDIQGYVTFAAGINGGELQISIPSGLTVDPTLVVNQRSFGDTTINVSATGTFLPSAVGGQTYFVIYQQLGASNITGSSSSGATWTFHISELPVTGL